MGFFFFISGPGKITFQLSLKRLLSRVGRHYLQIMLVLSGMPIYYPIQSIWISLPYTHPYVVLPAVLRRCTSSRSTLNSFLEESIINFSQYSRTDFSCLSHNLPGKMFGNLNTLRPTQNGRHFADDIFKYIFLNENVWISLKISLKFVPRVQINNIPALVQIMAWRRPGDKPLSEPMMDSLLTHICVTRPRLTNLPIHAATLTSTAIELYRHQI